MQIYIAFLRGINVGGSGMLRMKDLVSLLEELGFRSIKTYIQSGNAVFRYDAGAQASFLSGRISAGIKDRFGFEPQVLVMTLEELRQAAESNPFPGVQREPKTLHVGFLETAPTDPDLEAMAHLKTTGERFVLLERTFYLHAPGGVGKSKLAAKAERLLGVPMTLRNWRTLSKVIELAESIAKH